MAYERVGCDLTFWAHDHTVWEEYERWVGANMSGRIEELRGRNFAGLKKDEKNGCCGESKVELAIR